MISMEDWVTIRDLKKKNPGLGTRAIAKLFGGILTHPFVLD